MPSRQVQVDARRLQIGMPHQDLDGRQIGAVLQQVRGEAVPEHVGRNTFLEAGVPGGFGAGIPDGFICEMVVPALCDPTGKEPGLWFFPPPVLAKCFKQLRTQWRIAILAALTLPNVNDHALAVDVLYPEPHQFTAPHARRIEQHEDGPSLEIAGGVNQLSYFLRTEDLRNAMTDVLWVRNRVGREASLQRTHEEEPQTGSLRHDGSYRQFPFVQQIRLILAYLVRTELIGRLAEVTGEPLDCA